MGWGLERVNSREKFGRETDSEKRNEEDFGNQSCNLEKGTAGEERGKEEKLLLSCVPEKGASI